MTCEKEMNIFIADNYGNHKCIRQVYARANLIIMIRIRSFHQNYSHFNWLWIDALHSSPRNQPNWMWLQHIPKCKVEINPVQSKHNGHRNCTDCTLYFDMVGHLQSMGTDLAQRFCFKNKQPFNEWNRVFSKHKTDEFQNKCHTTPRLNRYIYIYFIEIYHICQSLRS